MAAKKPVTPLELLRDRLASRPIGTRAVLVADPHRLIDWQRTLADRKGCEWQVVLYRGDDCVTRRAWRRAWSGPAPVCLVLSRPVDDGQPLNASALADLIARCEGEPVDLSLPGYFHTLFPKINPPLAALAEFREQFIGHVEAIQKAYPQFKARFHEPDSWSRGQFLAVLAIAQIAGLTLDDVWCDETEPTAFAAHAVWLLCHPGVKPEHLRLISEVIWESSRQRRGEAICGWLDVAAADLGDFRQELAVYLVLRDALAGAAIEHVDALLAAKLRCHTFDPVEVGRQAAELTAALKDRGRWADVQLFADEALLDGRLGRAGELLTGSDMAAKEIIERPGSSIALLALVARAALLGRMRGGQAWPSWAGAVSRHRLLAKRPGGDSLTAAEQSAASLLSAIDDLRKVENALATPLLPFGSAEELLDWYVRHELHLLELRGAEALARLETLDDAELQKAAFDFVMARPNGLRYRVRAFLNRLDEQVGGFVEADPQKFLQGPRSALRIIPDVLRRAQRRPGGRVWVLVMDGMRYDTWETVVRPLLAEHFEVVDGQDRPYFSLLPSKTDIARRGLLAANLGKDWKNFFQKPTKEERVLAARALGLSKQDFADRIVFVTDAETTQAREKLGYDPEQGRDYNVLIYPISDDLGHSHNDTLASLNESIRQQLLTQQRRRGVIDDLRRRVQAGDIILLTSDHGFQELFDEESIKVSRAAARNSGASEEDVAYRYLRFQPAAKPPQGKHVKLDWEELGHDGKRQTTKFTLPVGGAWYQREGGRAARFAHGGISLAEMVIPAVLMRAIERKTARVEFAELPRDANVNEDESLTLSFELVNTGNIDTSFELVVTTNLGEVLLEESGSLAAAKRLSFSCQLTGRYESDHDRTPIADQTTSAVLLKLSHGDIDGRTVRPGYGDELVRVHVKPKPTKIDTDVLRAFDDL